jgi:hypothetical protein
VAKFVVRIELYGIFSNSVHYKTLANAMLRRGFSQTIHGADGSAWRLPSGEFNYEGDYTGEEVRAIAKTAVEETGLDGGVLVTEAVRRFWSGLPEIE